MSSNLIDYDKNDYEKPSLILGSRMGFMDTINVHYPKIWALYKRQKDIDWDEHEFCLASSKADFKTQPEAICTLMTRSISWLWGGDSVASRTLAPILAPFITNTEFWTTCAKITENECLHGVTYSEIARNSYDDPNIIMEEMSRMKEMQDRMGVILKVLDEGYILSHKYALGLVGNNQETFNGVVKLMFAIWCLERVMFMASFAVVFTICNTGKFNGIGNNVKKIAQDEIQIHSNVMREALTEIFKTERGKVALEQTRLELRDLLDEVIRTDHEWTDYLFSDGVELVGLTPKRLKEWTRYSSNDLFNLIGVESAEHARVVNDPLPFIDSNWLNPGKQQPARQETEETNYMTKLLVRTDEDKNFDVDF